MFLRSTLRKKNGKSHEYFSIVENKRVAAGKVVQRHVLYLGEINSSQQAAWRKTIEIFEDGQVKPKTVALFPQDRLAPIHSDEIVQIRLQDLQVKRARQWGACWLACELYKKLELDRFWARNLPTSRKGTRWDLVLQTSVIYRLLDPGSEWKLHRQWFEATAMGDLLEEDFALAESHKLYECLDRLLAHKQALFDHLTGRWKDLFNALWKRLNEIQAMSFSKKTDLAMKLGAAKQQAPSAWRLVEVEIAKSESESSFKFSLRKKKLRQVRQREGRYLLRSNLTEEQPAQLWHLYIQLTQVEEAFKNLKGDLSLRPLFHQKEARIEAHIFVAFLAYCLHATLRRWLRDLAPGLTPRSVLDKFRALQMIDVHLPTTDGRQVILNRYTQPEKELQLLLNQLKLQLPEQPPPKITASGTLAN